MRKMKPLLSLREKFLREKLLDIIGIINESTKHFDNDILKFEINRKYSIFLNAKDILKFRMLKDHVERNI